jgi:hypothetical protein
VTKDNDITWEPRGQDRYGSAGGGPKMGPSNYIVTEASKAQSLADLFLAVIPKSVFVEVARFTDKYCYKDFVVERTAKDSRGNVQKKKVLTHCDASTPEARHRTKNEET